MSILIKGATLPDSCWDCDADFAYKIGCELWQDFEGFCERRHPNCPLIEIPTPHGRLIDGDELSSRMYHEAFETDTSLQKWDGGCWIRYKMFENCRDSAPTILEAEE